MWSESKKFFLSKKGLNFSAQRAQEFLHVGGHKEMYKWNELNCNGPTIEWAHDLYDQVARHGKYNKIHDD